jgi:hypothetical protein
MTDNGDSGNSDIEVRITPEELGWIESIRAAQLRILKEEGLEPDRRGEIEEGLLRDLGFRAPHPIGALARPLDKGDDKHWLTRQQRLSRWLRYVAILHGLSGASDRLRKYGAGDETVNLKIEAWIAGDRLFRDIGGGRSPSHVRKTIQAWGREFGTYDPEIRFRVPVPTGDPPPGIFD